MSKYRKKNTTFAARIRNKGVSLVNLLTRPLSIMGEIINKMFLSSQAIFRTDKYRYARLLDEEFEEFCKLIDSSKLKYEGHESDKKRMRQDVINLFQDFKKAKEEYKKEKAVLYGEGE